MYRCTGLWWAPSCWSESGSSLGLKRLARRTPQPRAQTFGIFLNTHPANPKEMHDEIELDLRFGRCNRSQHTCRGTNRNIHRGRTAAIALRGARTGARSGLRLGRWVLGPEWAPLPVGGGTLGPPPL